MKRCAWSESDMLLMEYHDKEWGVPVYDDRLIFELLILEGAQAGLSWSTVLKKRENYRKAFDNFDAEKIASYSHKKVQKLIHNKGIIRNRLKIESAIRNAILCLKIKDEFGSFHKYIWGFVGNKSINNKWENVSQIPARSNESDRLSKGLKKRGFNFVGSTICYAFMQAVGMVNDHTLDCFRYSEIEKMTKVEQE